MAPLKLFLMCSGIAAGEECLSNCETPEDQMALLQSHLSRKGELAAHNSALLHFPSLGNLKDPKKRRGSLAQFEQTATKLLKDRDSDTPGLKALANNIVDLLRDTALPAIQHEHDNDANQIQYEFRVFAPMQLRFSEMVTSIANYDSDSTHAAHDSCRTDESNYCQTLGICTSALNELEDDLDVAKRALDEIDTLINANWCVFNEEGVLNDRTDDTFRLEQQTLFRRYNAALTELTGVQTSFDAATTTCSADEGVWLEKRTECNTLQESLQSAACQHKGLVDHDLLGFDSSWVSASTRYEATVASVIVDQADRIVEWTTVEKVICLLNQLAAPSGDSASSEATQVAIEACHNLIVDTSALSITPPVIPIPDALPWPSATENPCTAEFRAAHYSGIALCPVAGSPEQSYPGLTAGALEECDCLMDTNTSPFISLGDAFPHALISYLLYDAGATFGPGGFSLNVATQIWTLVRDGFTYSGRISSTSAISLPALNEAYELSDGNVAASFAWAYPADDYVVPTAVGEAPLARFLRTGGYVYLNDVGNTVALKVVTPWHGADDEAQMTLHWREPAVLAESDATSACEMHPVTSGRLQFGGATDYCWTPTGTTLAGCEHGCFIFKTQSDEYLSFGISA